MTKSMGPSFMARRAAGINSNVNDKPSVTRFPNRTKAFDKENTRSDAFLSTNRGRAAAVNNSADNQKSGRKQMLVNSYERLLYSERSDGDSVGEEPSKAEIAKAFQEIVPTRASRQAANMIEVSASEPGFHTSRTQTGNQPTSK